MRVRSSVGRVRRVGIIVEGFGCLDEFAEVERYLYRMFGYSDWETIMVGLGGYGLLLY